MEELKSESTTVCMTSFSDGNISDKVFNNDTKSAGVKDEYHTVSRTIIITTFPFIIIIGTIGNLLTFFVMRRGSLKHSSTCFYMAILALSDTGK